MPENTIEAVNINHDTISSKFLQLLSIWPQTSQGFRKDKNSILNSEQV